MRAGFADGAAKPHKRRTQKLISLPVAAITVLAVSGTSIMMPVGDYDPYDKFMRDLKLELGGLSPSMEFVQSLSDPPYSH